ncbi:MAG: hypothetical protein SFV21_05770 [Rhodospirillaceae bacterium]|nr:hypothetical protein [Rhodospirillaceae bacterium]
MSEPIKIRPVARGKRPHFFDDPAIDQLMAIVMAMSAEMSVLWDRVDTMERLLDEKGTLSRADVEAYRPDQAVHDERTARRNGYIDRIFRIIREERESLVPHEKMDEYRKIMDDVSKT